MWVERVKKETPEEEVIKRVNIIKTYLAAYELDAEIVLYASDGSAFRSQTEYHAGPDVLDDTDILLNMSYGAIPKDGRQFRKKILIDIDPGLTQNWIKQKMFDLDVHDRYFTIGEHIEGSGQNRAKLHAKP